MAITTMLQYPFSDQISPFAAELQKEVDGWLDTMYTSLDAASKIKYKQTNFGYAIARSFPTVNDYEMLRAFTRYLTWATIMEDQHRGQYAAEELMNAAEQISALLEGLPNLYPENDIFTQAALSGHEFSRLATPVWLSRFRQAFLDYYRYGLVEAHTYSNARKFPRLAHFQLIRQRSMGSYPFILLMDLGTSSFWPEEIFGHPVIVRLRSLTARLIAWQNDIFSMQRKKDTPQAFTNLILVIQNEYALELEDAVDRALLFNKADLDEFMIIQEDLPDLGQYGEAVKTLFYQLGVLLSGLTTWYLNDTTRYVSESISDTDKL